MKKKLIFGLFLFIIAFAFASVVKIKAGTSENSKGWIWGGAEDASVPGTMGVVDGNEGGLGLISLNSLNCDGDGNGITDKINNANCPVGQTVASYGVNIPEKVGDPVTGYAWSENFGWIDFQPRSGCPGSPKYTGACDEDYPASPKTDARKAVSGGKSIIEGWGRIVSIAEAKAAGNSGGWSGWIKFSGTAQDGSVYETVIDDATGTVTGYATSSADELGGIEIKGTTVVKPTINFVLGGVDVGNNEYPKYVDYNWTATNATSCKAITNAGNNNWKDTITGTTASGQLKLDAKDDITLVYQVECTGDGGTVVKDASVYKFCNAYKCNASTKACKNEQPAVTDVNNLSACVKECSLGNNDACKTPQATDWKEVIP